MRFVAFLVAILALVGCSAGPLSIANEVPDLQADLEAAALEWNAVCGDGTVTLDPAATQTVELSDVPAEHNAAAATYSYGIRVNPVLLGFDQRMRIETMAHEMGHALGLDDNQDEGDIMFLRTTGTRHVRSQNCPR